MELKPIFRERSDDAGHELPRDYFLGVALEVMDSRFGHADHSIVNRASPATESGALTRSFGLG